MVVAPCWPRQLCITASPYSHSLKRYGQRERATPAKSCKARRTAAGKRSIEPVRQLSPPEKARSDILLRIADRSKKENQNRRTGKRRIRCEEVAGINLNGLDGEYLGKLTAASKRAGRRCFDRAWTALSSVLDSMHSKAVSRTVLLQ
jgi:hypothetical protein